MPASRPVSPVVRKLWAAERGRMRDHLLRLTAEDRRLRFGGGVSDTRIAQYCAGVDCLASVVIAYLVDDEVRGMGELCRVGSPLAQRAEVALSVEAAFQDRGIGTLLFRRLVTAARNRSVRDLRMVCLAENTKMRAIARKFGAAVALLPGEAEARIALDWPSHLTLAQEALEESWAVMQLAVDTLVPRLPVGK